jgi:Concanavalin A-like lectin/glucanases superfamily
MSLQFTTDESVSTINSDDLSVFTFACWVNLTSYGLLSGDLLFVKDSSEYQTLLAVNSDGTLSGSAGADYLGGIQAVSVVAAGTSYHVGDTGVVIGGYPDQPDNESTYIVLTVDGSNHVLTVGIVGPGQGFATGSTYSTVAGGSQPGTGSGLTVHVTSIVNQTYASSQSNETVPLNTPTHVAMTWDGNGDKLVHLYINGVECTYEGGQTSSNVGDGSTGPWAFGGDGLPDGSYTEGAMSEVVIYQTALTAGQVATLAASTTGATGSPLNYWHFCSASPALQIDVISGNNGTLSVPPPTTGPASPGFNCIFVGPTTPGTVGVGSFGGSSLATAFYNPYGLDLIQVVNEGGDVVWSLAADGTATTNPVTSTPKALIGRYEGSSFALAFPNPYSLNIFQVIGQGDNIVFWVDSDGNASS